MADAKRVVIWDVDDVLNDLMRDWFEQWWLPSQPECPCRFDELSQNPPHTILGIAQADYLASLDAFREARFLSLAPRADVLRWFESEGDRAHHVALTATPRAFAPLSAAWVMTHFGEWIRTFAFVPAPRGRTADAGRRAAKADYLEWLGRGDVFVDDRAENVAAASTLGLQGVIVPQPWNVSPHQSLPAALAAVTRVL